jgi:hypothetical protein
MSVRATEPDPTKRGAAKTVLVVDDNPAIGKLLAAEFLSDLPADADHSVYPVWSPPVEHHGFRRGSEPCPSKDGAYFQRL